MIDTETLKALSARADQGEWHMYGESEVGLEPAPFVGRPLEGNMHPIDVYSSENASFVCEAVNFTRAALARDVDLDAERAEATHDAKMLGLGFLVDGMRVDPSRVTMIRRHDLPDSMSSSELWKALEHALAAKGASDAWLAYAMPALHVAAMQFAFSMYGQGHRDALAGIELPNPRPSDEATGMPFGGQSN